MGTGSCIAAAMAQQSDGAFYAAAPTADEAGWALVYKDPHEEDIAQEDGSTKKITINEATQLKSLMDNLKSPPGGFWLAGKKIQYKQDGRRRRVRRRYVQVGFRNVGENGC